MKPYLLTLFLLLFSISVFAQTTGTITGKVTDSKTGEVLPFCNVFINNTTLSTVTDIDGKFTLPNVPEGEVEVAFSFIGYQAIQKPASIKPGGEFILNVSMVSFEQELSDVEIKATRDKAWERELRRFKNLFLGNDNLASQCEILNPWVIEFPEENTTNSFRATAIQPIEIKNNGLGYNLTFDLKEFYFTPQYYIIAGATRFVEMDTSAQMVRQVWEKNREETYKKSPANMFRSMIQNQHNQEGFMLYGNKPGGSETLNMRSDIFSNELGKSVVIYNPENLITPGRKPGEYKIYFKGRVEIHYEKGYSTINTYKDAPYPISWIEVNGNYVNVNTNGVVLNQKDVTFSGDMDKRKVATLLPMDYNPPFSLKSNTQMAKDANGLQEKVYLHLDRPFYYKGDQLFFKAYLNYNNQSLKKELSKVLYVELISENRDLLIQKKFKIENGQAVGDMFLPDTLNLKKYYLRSYTTWNRNYGPDTYFVKAVPVLSPYDRITESESVEESTSQITAVFTPNKPEYSKREKVSLDIRLQDQKGNPVSANLSVSVTDNHFVTPISLNPTILNGLVIKEVPKHITTDKFTYPIEKDMRISGQFFNEKGKPEAIPFTAYFNNFSATLELESDIEGKFNLEEMDFYGPLDFTFMALDKKGNSYGKFQIISPLKPPFFVPESVKMPKFASTNEAIFSRVEEKTVELQQVIVNEEVTIDKTRAIYGKADHVVQGDLLMRGGNSTDLLLSLKPYIPGMAVNSFGQVTLRGGATSLTLSLEPMVMVDGAILPGNSAASNINSINPNDVERIEVVTRMASIMGDMGRNGVIAIYLKKGGQPSSILNTASANMNTIVVDGFSVPNNFFQLSHENEGESLPLGYDERATLYWNPYQITDGENGKLQIEFFMNDNPSSKSMVIEGLTIDGTPIRAKFMIPSGK
ncbi:TonB-dependent receptor [Aquiflexum sp. LQ15W]|uniref:carboxypeptidase-like regulatory domain-containing protein n=1 Tax=Cognataquiflexum nitidum TaxID=2922272 RepID=UPI001F148AC2|nr:TonB-dependent receptor [Cognataquiflexum nitidum]MCH6198586.1 TonB-dependent receptor [Cognataquiflexum nitidum]